VARTRGSDQGSRAAHAPAPPGGTWPLTGREGEMRQLAQAVRTRRSRSVVLVGPAGVGKTRLAREALRMAEITGHVARWVAATHATSTVPFGALAGLLPAAQSEPASGMAELLRTSAGALCALGADRRLLLCVDDAHLLDETSAALLYQLVASDAVTIIATVRSGEAAPEPITALWKDEVAERLEIAALAPETLATLLAETLGGEIDPAASAALTERSEGNVLLLRELVLGALADGTLIEELGIWRLAGPLRPSERLVGLVEQRLRTLSGPERRMLELISYGGAIGPAELSEDLLLVEALERAGMVDTEMDRRRCVVRLAHPIYGEVVRRLTPAVRIATLARTLAASVEACGARRREDALRVGIWRLDGGGGSSAVLLKAAAAARWGYDFALAERLARASLEAAPSFEAGLLAAQCRALQGDADQADLELTGLERLAADDAQRTRLAVARIDGLWLGLGRMTEARHVAEDAEQRIGDQNLRDEVSGRRAAILLGTEGPQVAAEVADEILGRARGQSLAWIGVVGSFSFARLGRIQDALEAADRAHHAGMNLSTPYSWYPWFGVYARCEALAQAGAFKEAARLAQEHYERGLADGSSEERAFFLWHLARTTHDRGRPEVAARQAREGLALFRQLGYGPHQHSMGSVLALALALQGQAGPARDALEELERLPVTGLRWSVADHRLARAWTFVAEGALARARAELLELADLGEDIGELSGAAAALHDVARLGHPKTATTRLQSLAERCEGELVAARAAHVLALAADDIDGLEEVSARFETLGAELLAAEAAADAAARVRRAGSQRPTSRAQQRLSILRQRCGGASTPALDALGAGSELTPAEHETARLAAGGRSNRRIAAELNLSVRTVDNRLHRIYSKLGITGREQLKDVLSNSD
jgi:DNA-binding CsgD family transcriptional regulator